MLLTVLRTGRTVLAVPALCVATLAAASSPAWAGGWHHGGTSFGLSLSLPLAFGYGWPAPYYYPPPPVVYAPPPQVATPTSPTYLAPSGRYCREFQMPGVVNGRRVDLHGTACLDPDGSWRVAR
ncbi:hypothetical protein [Azospirillum sp. sgz302134]